MRDRDPSRAAGGDDTGQTIRLLVETADTGRDSLLEAGLDDINITQN